MQRFRTGLFSRPERSGKPPKGSEENFEQKPSSSSAEERCFTLDSGLENEDSLCSTECPEYTTPECLHSVTNPELVNVTLHQEQLQQMRLYKEDVGKYEEKVKQLVSLLALKEEAEKDLTARMTQQQEEYEKDRLSWLEDKKNALIQATEMKSRADHLHGKYTKLEAKANHDSHRVKVLSSALNAEQAKLKSLKEEHSKEIEALRGVKSGSEVSDLLRTEKLVSLSDEVSQLSSLKNSLLEENQQLRHQIDDAENYSMKVLSKYCNSDGTYKETLKGKQIVIGALQQLEKSNLTLMQRNSDLNDEKHQLELEKQQIQEEKDSVLQKLYTLQDSAKRVRDVHCGLNTKVSNFQSLTERQKEEIKRLSVELKTSKTKEKHLAHEVKELTAKAAEISLVSKSRKKELECVRITVAKYKINEVLLNETIAGLTEKLCHFDSLTKKNEETLDALNCSLHVAECAASKYSKKLQESNRLNNKLQSDIRRQVVMLEELQTTKKSLHKDIQHKATAIASLISQVEQTKAENEHLMQEVQEVKQNQKILMKKNEAMKANVTQLRSFEKQTKELRKESKKSRDKEKPLKAKVDELTSLLKAKDTEIDHVKTELQNSRTSESDLNHVIANLAQQMTNINREKQTAEEKVHCLSALVKDTEEDKRKLATVIQDLEEENGSLKTNNAKLQSEVEGTLADNRSLLRERTQLAGQITTLNDQLTKLQSQGNVGNQNSECPHKSFQECRASRKVLQEQIRDLEKQLKEERQKKRKSDQESKRGMFDSFAESSSMIQPDNVQRGQSVMSQDGQLRRVTSLDSIEEPRPEKRSELRALEHTDDPVCDITLNQDAEQSTWQLSPEEQALVKLIEMLNEQIEQRNFQDLNKKTENNLPNITSYEKTEEQVSTISSEETAKKPPKDMKISMKMRMFFQVITFGWIFKWVKRKIRGNSHDMQKEERLQDISVDDHTEEHLPNTSWNFTTARTHLHSTSTDHVQDDNLQQLTEGQFCLGSQLTENVQLSYDERTNERLPQFRLEQQTEPRVQDSSVQVLERRSERRLITVPLVLSKLLIHIYNLSLTVCVFLIFIALKLKADEP